MSDEPGKSCADVDAAGNMIRRLADAGILDRTFQIKVGCVEVNLGPADMPSSIASMSDEDPKKRILLSLLGRGRTLGEVG